jgi:hypothetical protein
LRHLLSDREVSLEVHYLELNVCIPVSTSPSSSPVFFSVRNCNFIQHHVIVYMDCSGVYG